MATDYATTGDGQLTALQFLDVLARSGKKASELASVCPQYPQVLLNVAVSHERGVKDAIMASDAAIAEEAAPARDACSSARAARKRSSASWLRQKQNKSPFLRPRIWSM